MSEPAEPLVLNYNVVKDDYTRAGEASGDVKKKLRMAGVDSAVIRKVAICMYEGEINMVIHAEGGRIRVEIFPDRIRMILMDKGPGIKDVSKAMQAGWSTASEEARNLGFGAGMGLPNMKKNSDTMDIDTVLGQGTTVTMTVNC
ncbi:MAG: ATP-binding protein [Lachnospiraceae bacterium]|jgi:serine/threonine-protein kinase RsbT|nr:ATP-binding protein [Lachnospiraceae bacterium]MCI1726120.1 ATP-binding protein [Lachnospiraceae bacterium]